jgi:hypothetical protein
MEFAKNAVASNKKNGLAREISTETGQIPAASLPIPRSPFEFDIA